MFDIEDAYPPRSDEYGNSIKVRSCNTKMWPKLLNLIKERIEVNSPASLEELTAEIHSIRESLR